MKKGLKGEVILKDKFIVKLDPFHPYSCMHLELMHRVFQRTALSALTCSSLGYGRSWTTEMPADLLSFRKIVAQKHTQLPCQTISWLKLCWARLVEKHKRISFSCCNLTRLKWHDLYVLPILRSMWLHMNHEPRFIPECNQPKELSYKSIGCREPQFTTKARITLDFRNHLYGWQFQI
jgi:hypothetical protein